MTIGVDNVDVVVANGSGIDIVNGGGSETSSDAGSEKVRRPSQLVSQTSQTSSSPGRAPPNGIEKKKPFLIGVAGGTASGKVRA